MTIILTQKLHEKVIVLTHHGKAQTILQQVQIHVHCTYSLIYNVEFTDKDLIFLIKQYLYFILYSADNILNQTLQSMPFSTRQVNTCRFINKWSYRVELGWVRFVSCNEENMINLSKYNFYYLNINSHTIECLVQMRHKEGFCLIQVPVISSVIPQSGGLRLCHAQRAERADSDTCETKRLDPSHHKFKSCSAQNKW